MALQGDLEMAIDAIAENRATIDALMEALEAAKDRLDPSYEKEELFTQIDAALALARGEG